MPTDRKPACTDRSGGARRRLPRWGAALGAAAAVLLHAGLAQAAPEAVALPGARAHPENVASRADGALYVSSFAEGGVVRVAPGAATGEVWIKPGAYGSRSIFGLLADEATNTLWVCSNDLTMFGIPGPGDAKGSALKGFDLTTGEGKISAALPGARTICNDIALGSDGAVYVTNTLAPEILRLKPGAAALEVWASDPLFDGGPKGAGLDGIAFGRDGHLYVNTFTKGDLLRVETTAGAAGKVVRLETSRPLVQPDGMRLAADGSFLMAEGGGAVDRVTIDGAKARIETLRDGFTGGPTGVALVGDVVWVAEGQLSLVLDPAKTGETPSLPFRVRAVKPPAP